MAENQIQPYISSNVSDLANYILNAYNNIPHNSILTKQDFINILSGFANQTKPIFFELSTIHPDFEALKQQFIAELSNRDAWRDIIQAGGGATVVDFISSIGVYNTDAVAVALQETNLDTAGLDSSIYTIMRMIGVHILRRRPAQRFVTITKSIASAVIIPTLTQFTIGATDYFNRTPIILNSTDDSVQAVLYQGTINNLTILSTGSPFQRLEIGNSDYSISDDDIYCYLPDGTQYAKVTDGLWKYSANSLIFGENSTPEGNVEILFGNNLYGAIPPINTLLAFVYANTLGAKGNTLTDTGEVKVRSFSAFVPDRITLETTYDTQLYQNNIIKNISGSANSNPINGSDPYDKEFYRAVGPYLGTGKKGSIRKSEYYAVALTYPGIADVLIRNQKDIEPYNRNLINVVGVTPLMTTGQPMTNDVWLDFVKFMKKNDIWRLDYKLYQPIPRPLDIHLKLYCALDSDIANTPVFAETIVKQVYGIRRGALGYSYYESDLYDNMLLNFYNIKVDYVDIYNPVSDIIISPLEYFYVNSLNIEVEYTKRGYLTYSPNIQNNTTLLT